MAAVHFGPVDEPVKLVFLHANGFTGLTYRSILEPLGVHVLALDLRGHGRTTLPIDDLSMTSHTHYAKDFGAYLQAHIDEPVIVAGHSLGANAAIIAANMVPGKISCVLAFDPVVLPLRAKIFMMSRFGRTLVLKNNSLVKNAGRRRDVFTSRGNVYERYHGRGTFKHFPDQALKDYIQDGFIDYEDGVRLACRPLWEQHTYINQAHNLKTLMAGLPDASHIMITDFIGQTEGWMVRARRKNPKLRIDYLPAQDHFFPVTNPDISMAALRDILA